MKGFVWIFLYILKSMKWLFLLSFTHFNLYDINMFSTYMWFTVFVFLRLFVFFLNMIVLIF